MISFSIFTSEVVSPGYHFPLPHLFLSVWHSTQQDLIENCDPSGGEYHLGWQSEIMVFINYQVRQVALGQSKDVGTGAAPENGRAGGAGESPKTRRKGRKGRQGHGREGNED